MNVVAGIGLGLLTCAALLLVVRITVGPTMLDRVVALDVLIAVLIAGLGIEAAATRHATTLPILLVLAMLGFVGSVSVARFTAAGPDDGPGDEGNGRS